MMLLSGGPWQRGHEKGVCQRLVVREQGLLPLLQQKTKAMNSRVGSKELSVEGGIFGLGGR